MGYFSSLLRHTGLGSARAAGQRPAPWAPLEVHETRLVAPQAPAAQAEAPALEPPSSPASEQAPAAVLRPDADHPTAVASTALLPPVAREDDSIPIAPSESPSVELMEAVEERFVLPPTPAEAPTTVRFVASEHDVAPRRQPESMYPAARPAPPKPASVAFEEVRRWVAAPLIESAAREPEPTGALLSRPSPTPLRAPQPPHAAAEEAVAEPRTENFTLSIGSIQVIVEDAAPRPAAVPPQAPAGPPASTASSLDSTRLARCYVTL